MMTRSNHQFNVPRGTQAQRIILLVVGVAQLQLVKYKLWLPKIKTSSPLVGLRSIAREGKAPDLSKSR